jgi:ribosomal-protein-alanine N-acetyltransferase
MPAPKTVTQAVITAARSRVYLRRPRPRDAAAFCAAVRSSRAIHSPWMQPPATPKAYAAMLARCRQPAFKTLLVCRHEDDALVGVFDLSQIFRGIMQSAYLGYYALAPHAARGYMREGLQLMLRYAFGALRLHRVESNIQPANKRSIGLARRAGFTREGYSRRYLKIGGRWRDHERWALLVEDWRARRKPQR